jgi:hypothetical protein
MHQQCSRDLSRSRVPHPWTRTAWGLLGATSLTACGTLKVELCTPVHTRVLEELRTTDGTAHHVSDPSACERHARRLQELSEELGALEIRDEELREPLETYRREVERLSEAYARLAAAYQAQPEVPPEEARRVHTPLRREVLNHAASLSAPRLELQRACSGG